MKIQIKNLGVLRQAEFSLGDMTILCGGNNTGKTYATYALFGFLSLWREILSIPVADDLIKRLLAQGSVTIDINQYRENAEQILFNGCQTYVKRLPTVFATSEDRFKTTEFQISADLQGSSQKVGYQHRIGSANMEIFSITGSEDGREMIITLLVEKKKLKIPPDIIRDIISDSLKEVIFANLFPKPFIACAERTGVAVFRRELNFDRNRLLEEVSQPDKKINPMELLFKTYLDYPLPVKANVDFTRQIGTIAKRKSFIAEKYPDVLADFTDIIGGEYSVTKNDELYYSPKGKRVRLSMDESSSAVRSLLDVGFFLHHVAAPGDLLMVDEPELNLHPENQRRVARLFACLVNLGIKVFVTTHSDYIVKELNTLIMLNHDKSHLKEIAEREGYRTDELLSADKIKVYIAEEAMVKLDGGQRKTRCQTLTSADIDPELGIEVRSFDTTIETMNRIQEEIIWGAEE